MSENLRKTMRGDQIVFASPHLDAKEVEEQTKLVGDAYNKLVAVLRRERIHPAVAMNALMNLWHSIAMLTAPTEVIPALDAMKEFHQRALVALADA